MNRLAFQEQYSSNSVFGWDEENGRKFEIEMGYKLDIEYRFWN